MVYVSHPPLSRFGTYGEAQEQHRRGTRDLLAFGEFEITRSDQGDAAPES